MEFSEIVILIVKIILTVFFGYITFVFAFYLFLKSLLKKPGHQFPSISEDSWHFKMIFPLHKYRSKKIFTSLEIGPIGYSTRLFFMIILGWPLLITLQTVKMIIYTPILVLFGYYTVPNMSLFDASYLASEVIPFHIPSILLPRILSPEPVRLYPIFFVLAFGYGFSLYNYPGMTLSITMSIIFMILLIVLAFYLAESGFFKILENLLRQKTNNRFSEFMRRYDPELTLDKNNDEDKII